MLPSHGGKSRAKSLPAKAQSVSRLIGCCVGLGWRLFQSRNEWQRKLGVCWVMRYVALPEEAVGPIRGPSQAHATRPLERQPPQLATLGPTLHALTNNHADWQVGYTIRFESLSSSSTQVLYLTDGMLFREILLDPLLSRYSVVMIDEAHERSTYTDLLLGVLKKIRRVRPSLRVIIASATIDAQSFCDFFNQEPPRSEVASSGVWPGDDGIVGAAAAAAAKKRSRWDKREREEFRADAVIVRLEGRAFPVEVAYLKEPTADVVQEAVSTIFDIHLKVSSLDRLRCRHLPDLALMSWSICSNRWATSWSS